LAKPKKQLSKIYTTSDKTFYCDCPLLRINKKLVPDFKRCNYKPRNKLTRKGKVNKRALRKEWEHVVPAWAFGHQLQCWQNGGRKNCGKNNAKFRKMEGDLHSLVPAIGEVNADRSNYSFGMLAGEHRVCGKCDAEFNTKGRLFEPAHCH
jgi:deoxyribonuclease-1